MACKSGHYDQQVAKRRSSDHIRFAGWTRAIAPTARFDPGRSGGNGRVPNGFVLAVKPIDVTEPKLLATLQPLAERRLGDFLASLGHELRNPLAGISSAIEVLDTIGSADAVVNEMRGIVKRQSQQMSRLIDDLLDISRVTHGKLQLQSQQVDLAELIRCTCADFRFSAAASGISLEVKLPAQPLWLNADPTRMTQVLVNLLQNAVKFTDRKGVITVTLCRDADRAVGILSVRDTGIGMEQQTLAQVFEPFNQAERSVTRSRDGLGLGLALVKGLVEMHGGHVTATSGGPGRGSQFSVRLPLTDDLLVSADQPVKVPHKGSSYRILLIDDSRDAVYPLMMLLTRMGHDVEIAADGEIGVTAAGQFRPHVVLCDIGLPGNMDGYAVAAALRDGIHTRHTHLVAVTGYSREEDRCRAIEAGFDRHMTKPIGVQELESILAGLPAAQGEIIPMPPIALPIARAASLGAIRIAPLTFAFDEHLRRYLHTTKSEGSLESVDTGNNYGI